MSHSFFNLNRQDGIFGENQLEKIKENLELFSKKIQENEMKISNGRLYYQQETSNTLPFLEEESVSSNIYRFVSSISSLIDSEENASQFSDENFFKDKYLNSLRIGEIKVNKAFKIFLDETMDWAVNLRYRFSLAEHAFRSIAGIITFIFLISILNFEQKGFKVLSFLKKKDILDLKKKVEIFKENLSFVLEVKREEAKRNKLLKSTKSGPRPSRQKFEISSENLSRKSHRIKFEQDIENMSYAYEISQREEQAKKNLFSKKYFAPGSKQHNKLSTIKEEMIEESMKFPKKIEILNDCNKFKSDERSKKLHINQSKRKTIITVSVLPLMAYFFMMGALMYFFEKKNIENTSFISKEIFLFTNAAKNLDYKLSFVYHDLENGNDFFTEKGNLFLFLTQNLEGIFEEYGSSMYNIIGEIYQISDFPYNSAEVEEKFEIIFKGNLCQNIPVEEGIECPHNSILENSLYTVSIYIVETLRKFKSMNDVRTGIEVLKTKEFQQFGIFFKIIIF